MTDIPLIAASVDQLMDLVNHYIGTISGVLPPEQAQALQGINISSNRPVSESSARRFEEIARSGAWAVTGEPLIVSRDGKLIDGQHRLAGIIRSGCSVVVDIRFGANPQAFQAMGSGARRTAAHSLQILGMSYGPTQAGIAKLVYLHDNKLFGSQRGSVETPTIVRVVTENPSIGVIGKAIQASKFKPVRSSGFGFPLVLAARVSDMTRIFEFIDMVSTGLSDTPTRPTRALHQRLLDAISTRESLDQMTVATLVARCWNAFVEGREIKNLRVQKTDRTGEHFPKIVGAPAE